MTDKYKDKYRIASTRLQNWNYGWNATYFLTICTKNRECNFGKIIDHEMQLSEIGRLANKYWTEIPKHFPFVKLDTFMFMPNHVHGIIIIDKPNKGRIVETPNLGVSTDNFVKNGGKNDKWESGNLGVIINQYKRICTINARKINSDFAWQSRYYDHIIRNESSFHRIKNYIMENPKNWNKDKFFN